MWRPRLLCFTLMVSTGLLVCFIHFVLRAHPDPVSHVRVKNVTFLQSKIISTASCPQWWRALLQPDHITHSKYYSSGASEASGGRRLFGPCSRGSKRRLGIKRPGCWGHGRAVGWVGACESILIRKQGALVSRSHHHQQLSMNEYEATFMNILSSVIFLFQLSFSPSFPALSDFLSSTLIFHLLFLFLSPSVSVLLWRVSGHRVLYHEGVTSAPRSYLNLACPKDFWSLTQGFKKTRTLPHSSHRETQVKSLFSFFPYIHQCRDVGYPLSESWHPSSCEITTRMETNCAFFHSSHSNYAFFPHSMILLFVFHVLKRCPYTFISLFPISVR